MSFNHIVPVGLPVHYHRSGTEDPEPVAAIITHINDEGVADLVEFPRHGGELVPKRGVRHFDDPWHKSSPDVSRQYGAWKFLPEVEVKKPEKKQLPESSKAAK